MVPRRTLTWAGIVRLGLVQAALGSIVVITTSTLNRVMVVELALPATLPGILVALHYFVQITRPRFGHGSDIGGRRTPWIIGGMCVLGIGGVLAAIATAWMSTVPAAGIALAVLAFILVGGGVGASGTSLLVLLATSVTAERRAAAATLTWIMMIAGFAVTAGIVGAFLDPFSFARLVAVSGCVSLSALLMTVAALWRLEGRPGRPLPRPATQSTAATATGFRQALRDVLAETHTRRFAIFVFISMLAYSAQDLILEPFAGAVFGLTPGQSTQLGGLQHGGVLLGMLLVAFLGSLLFRRKPTVLRNCMIGGCIASATGLVALAIAAFAESFWPLASNVFLLGVANGVFAVAAIGSMMGLVSQGKKQRDGVRMGIWGAAQAIAFGLGGIAGTVAVDIARYAFASTSAAYSLVFAAQAILFVVAARLAAQLSRNREAAVLAADSDKLFSPAPGLTHT